MSEIPLGAIIAAASLWVCFGLAIFVPLFHGLRLLVGRAALQLRRRKSVRMVVGLREDPLQPDLSEAHRRLADDTRSILLTLEHACARAHRWSDKPAGSWWQQIFAAGSDAAYAPTIGMTGEVWHWLQQAEALCDNDEASPNQSLQTSTAAVRRVLFEDRPLIERLEALMVLLTQVDDSLRVQSGSPYRDTLSSKTLLSTDTSVVGEECQPEAQRVRRYRAALRCYRRAIRAIVFRFSDPRDREDLLQEIHLAIWNALPTYREESSLRTYVLRIARYRAIKFRQQRLVLGPEQEESDPSPAVDEMIDSKRRYLSVGRAVQRLPANLRLALQLRLEGFSYREIAERLGITEKNASVRVTRARRDLRRCVGSESR